MPEKNPKKRTSRRKKSSAKSQTQKRTVKKEPKKKAARTTKTAATKARKAPAKKSATKRAALVSAERIKPRIDLGRVFEDLGRAFEIKLRVSFARPDDLLVCDLIFDNMKLDGDKVVRKNPSRAATLIVELPPQSFGEQAFLDATGPEASVPPGQEFKEVTSGVPKKNVPSNEEKLGPLPFAKIRMAGRSRLAFSMPADVTEFAFTIEAILDACRKWPMRLDINAVPEPVFLDDPLKNAKIFDKVWLNKVSASADWARITQTLISAMDGEGELERRLASAAKRIAGRAMEGLKIVGKKGLDKEINRAMNAEMDTLARKFPLLSEGQQREVGMTALSLMATQAVASSERGEFSAQHFEKLPFVLALLSPHEPASTVTALELPYRVIVSPIPKANWWHGTMPVVHNGRTELWHTRLTNTDDGIGADRPTKIRALWSPDYEMPQAQIIALMNAVPPAKFRIPFRMSLDPLDRQMLVTLMSDFGTKDDNNRAYIPRAARSQRLALSALGALADVEGNWDTLPKTAGIEQWRHLATLGRDHYVRVVYKGYLCPSGHAASLIKVTERKFEYLDKEGEKNRVAVLRQRFFIVVRERVRQYNGEGHDFEGRNFPFKSVEILTRVTPNLVEPIKCKLNDPGNLIYGVAPPRACFWPMIDENRNFVFQMAATDLSGERKTFEMPLLFVGIEANREDGAVAQIIEQYNAELLEPLKPLPPRRTALFSSASVCYAPVMDGALGDPRLPTTRINFACEKVTYKTPLKPRYYPVIATANLGIAAIQRLLNQPNATVEVAYPDKYKASGFGGANKGEVFLKLITPFPLTFGDKVKSEALGGLATPSMAIQGLSRIMGPVAAKPPVGPQTVENALQNVFDNKFDPTDFFQGAKILGGVDLAKILKTAHSLAGPDVPKLLSKQSSDKIEARFDWKTDINNSDPLGLFMPNPEGKQTTLEMQGVVSSPIGQPTATTFEAKATIVNFRVNLFGFITVWFDRLSFISKSGSKPDVAVDLHPGMDAVAFGGPLEFVNELRSIIPSNGFSDPPSLTVTPSGISASYSLNIPSVAVGIFALEHVSLGAGFTLPFDAKPAEVRFNFAERQRPFSLTVSLLGGGGFFAIGVGTEGVREIEAALEFGAALSINLGVASGSVEIKAGIYFHWMQKSVELAGYVRLHGELSVLGLISASLTFNLQLGYLKENKRQVVWGEASLEVEIEILFLSFSVSVKCRREFGGSDSDPKFIALIPDQSTWTDYCEAFATEAP